MAIDLRALQAACLAQTGGEQEPAEILFWRFVRERAATDLCCYGLFVHGNHPTLRALAMSQHVLLWAQLLEVERQVLLICPPEHGKTTVMRWHLEQWIGQGTEAAYGAGVHSGAVGGDISTGAILAPSALLVMNTATQAEKQCMAIAATLESNKRYRMLYPHVKPAPKWGWTKSELYCQRPNAGDAQPDPTLQVTGMDGPIQGSRQGMIVIDDPTDQKDARSDKILESQREWLQGTVADRLMDGGLMRAIMTPWSKRGVQQMYIESDMWVSCVLPAIDQAPVHMQPPIWPETYPAYPWGKTLWPEKWNEARLEAKRKEKELIRDSGLWQLAWMCNPVSAAGNLFKRAWILYEESPKFASAAR